MNLTNDDVQEILRLLDASPYDELHIETERFKLTLRRAGTGSWTQERQTLANPQVAQAATARPSAAPSEPAAAAQAQAQAQEDGLLDIRTPIVGTFYRAPKPGAAPFVDLGAKVDSDTVVAIVETMKLMNSVYAGVRGEVVEICVADGEFVEQHHLLMRVRPEPT